MAHPHPERLADELATKWAFEASADSLPHAVSVAVGDWEEERRSFILNAINIGD